MFFLRVTFDAPFFIFLSNWGFLNDNYSIYLHLDHLNSPFSTPVCISDSMLGFRRFFRVFIFSIWRLLYNFCCFNVSKNIEWDIVFKVFYINIFLRSNIYIYIYLVSFFWLLLLRLQIEHYLLSFCFRYLIQVAKQASVSSVFTKIWFLRSCIIMSRFWYRRLSFTKNREPKNVIFLNLCCGFWRISFH